MVAYQVVFQMPAWVAKGLADRTYEVVGGVVRKVGSKQVVMWLRAGADRASKVGAPTLRPLATLSGGMALSLAATASVGLIAVAGFVMMKQQHEVTLGRLDALMDVQKKTKQGVDELLADAAGRARNEVLTALETIAMEEERRAFDALQNPITALRINGKNFADKMRSILRRSRPMASAGLFVELAILFSMTAQAKARALTLYAGVEAAEREAMADQAIYADLRVAFLMPLQQPEQHLNDFALMTEAQDVEMRSSLPRLPRPEELEYIRLPGLTRDPDTLKALLDVIVSRANEPTAGIIPSEVAPEGWTPELEIMPAQRVEVRA